MHRIAPRRSSPALDPRSLVELIQGVAQATELWRPLAHHDPDQRGGVRLIATDLYEVWVLGWTSGQGVDLHDHGGSHAAFQVVEGELVEIGRGRSGPTRRRLPAGAHREAPAGTIHDVINVSTAAATSIHAYSPPLTAMTFYDPIAGIPLRREAVTPGPAVLDEAGAALSVHPAGGLASGGRDAR
ncbi:MAG: cysteine dioxygenase [Acidimicrobiales bacterium]|nr:cysteine dioxygenase [Acidimicrobiales bacterium]